MISRLLKVVLTAALGAALYWLVALYTLPYAGIVMPRVSGFSPAMVYAVLIFTHWLVVVAFSVPFALVLAGGRLSLQRPVLVAFFIATVGLAVPAALEASFPSWAPSGMRWSHAVDLVKFALTLPALTWFAKAWLPSNNSSKPMPLRGTA